jgi:hypothetical protein
MKQKQYGLFSFLLVLFVMLISVSANADKGAGTGNSGMRMLGSGDPGYERYVQILESVRHDPDAMRCVFSMCQQLNNFAPSTWREGKYYEKCLSDHNVRKNRADYRPMQNPPTAQALLCSNDLGTRLPAYNKEVGERVFNRYETPAPVQTTYPDNNRDATDALAKLRELENAPVASASSVARVPTPKIARVSKKAKPDLSYLGTFAKTQPKAAAQIEARNAERRRSMRCIPKNTELVRQDPDGDVYLFVRAGADVAELRRCFPKHGFDARMTAHNNNAAAIIPYYLEDENKPIRGKNLRFHQGRWNIKKSQWKESGRTFYADWFKEHQDKKFGFALQAGQKIFLRMADTWVTENPTETDSSADKNETKSKQGYYQAPTELVPEEIDESLQYRLAENTAVNESNSHIYDDASRTDFESASASHQHVNQVDNAVELVKQDPAISATMSDAIFVQKKQNQSAGRAYIRAGPRVNRVMYITQERYRQNNDGADLNKIYDDVHLLAQRYKSLSKRHYGAYAFS